MVQTPADATQLMGHSIASEAILTKIGFRTRNLSLVEYQSLTEQERQTFHELAWEENRTWLAEQFQERGAEWLMVVDGQIIAYSSDLDEYPTQSEIMDIIETTGKFPFIFIDKAILAIEETHECARNWPNSPFVRINPTREALAGRDVPRKVGVSVTLDFVSSVTSVELAETT